MRFDWFDHAAFLRDYWQKRPLLIRNPWQAWSNPLEPDELAGLACEAAPGLGDGLILQVPASDGANDVIGKHGHPGTRFTRNRPLRGLDLHQTGVRTGQARHQGIQIAHVVGSFIQFFRSSSMGTYLD